MKALIVADLHYSLRQFDWLLRVAPDYDLVIIAGDLLDIAGHCDLDVFVPRPLNAESAAGGFRIRPFGDGLDARLTPMERHFYSGLAEGG